MTEQRRQIRNRTFLPARIEIAELGLAVPCTIRDLSESGARIQLSGGVQLPPSFALYIPRFDRRVRVTRAWQREDTIGVGFEAEVTSARDSAPADHRYVKKLEDEIARMRRLLEAIREEPMKARMLLDEAA